MTAMPPEPAHARPKPGRAGGIGAAWAILLGMGATSVTYNVVHAVHGGALNICLALVYGIAPVYGAALLSHVVAVHGGGKFMQATTFLLMLGAMALSIGATAAVVRPVAGVWMQWLFGVVIDGASLVALRVILNDRTARTAAATELEAVQAELRTALEAGREVAQDRSRIERDRAELEAELATVKAELEAERKMVPPRKPRRTSARNQARNPARTSARNQARNPARTSARNQVPGSAPEPGPEVVPVPGAGSGLEDVPDIDAEALILKYLAEGHSASQAGIMAGRSDSYGRQVARLARAARKEPPGSERTDGDVS